MEKPEYSKTIRENKSLYNIPRKSIFKTAEMVAYNCLVTEATN